MPPYPEESRVGVAKEIGGRRAKDATTAVVADEALLNMAKDFGLLEEGPPEEGGLGLGGVMGYGGEF